MSAIGEANTTGGVRLSQGWATAALLLPAYGWLLVAVFLPLCAMLAFSFLKSTPFGSKPLEFTTRHYWAFMQRPYLIDVAWDSLVMGFWTTGICAILGLPAAPALARATKGRILQVLFLLVILPARPRSTPSPSRCRCWPRAFNP